MNKIIIDIDNTLWDFASVLYDRLRVVNPLVPPPGEWDDWDFWTPYLTRTQAFTAIHEVHLHQEHFAPYPEAGWFLTSLKKRGFSIVIASHRRSETLQSTTKWLEKNGLVYDEIHLSFDKTVLFDTSWGIVDDSPIALAKARDAGIVRTGLRHPWNMREDHPLFDTLTEVLGYIDATERPPR